MREHPGGPERLLVQVQRPRQQRGVQATPTTYCHHLKEEATLRREMFGMRRKKRIAAVVIAVIVTAYIGTMVYLVGPLNVLLGAATLAAVCAIIIWAAETLLE